MSENKIPYTQIQLVEAMIGAMLQSGRRIRNENANCWDIVYEFNGHLILVGRISYACPLEVLDERTIAVWERAMEPLLSSSAITVSDSGNPSLILPSTLS